MRGGRTILAQNRRVNAARFFSLLQPQTTGPVPEVDGLRNPSYLPRKLGPLYFLTLKCYWLTEDYLLVTGVHADRCRSKRRGSRAVVE